MQKKALILGAGISGLSLAWYLSKKRPDLDITILEKGERPGGWMHTDHTTGFHFEKGPRSFKVSKADAIIELAEELGIDDQIILAEKAPYHRYLWMEGALHQFPSGPLSFCRSRLTRGFLKAALSEWRRPAKQGDETVWDFACRRFNEDVARLFFDPIVVGIFGGDSRKLSIRACFPVLKQFEEEYQSLTRGFIKRWIGKKSSLSKFPPQAIFTFQGGMETLPRALVEQLSARVKLGEKVLSVETSREHVAVHTSDHTYIADHLFCALPAPEAAKLFPSLNLDSLSSLGIAVVNVAYRKSLLPVSGFGYLTPTFEKELVKGVIFDSSVFPQLNIDPEETRLTIKLEERGGDDRDYISAALQGISRQLKITTPPDAIHLKRAHLAIPQYEPGHLDRMEKLEREFKIQFPRCRLLGNYLSGVSVNHCIHAAKELVKKLGPSDPS